MIKKHDNLSLLDKIACCKTETLPGAVIKQAIIDLSLNIESRYKNNYKISARRSIRNDAINYLISDLCRCHCNLISINYDDFMDNIYYLIQQSRQELLTSYQPKKKKQNEKIIQ